MAQEFDSFDEAAVFDPGVPKQLPSDIQAEKSVISACMLNSDAAEQSCVDLEPENFFRLIHRDIFAAIYEIVNNGETPDYVSVLDKLKAQKKLKTQADETYILGLQNATFGLTNWKRHIEIVKRCSIQRELIKASAEINELAYNAPDSIIEVVGRAEKSLFNVTEKRVSSSFIKMEKLCEDAFDEISQIANRKETIVGVPTGFTDLDELFCGFRGGDLVVIAARPGVGKTSFALNMAINSAKKGTSVAFFSLEMSSSQIVQRIMCSESRVPLSRIRSAKLTQSDWSQLTSSMDGLAMLDLSIDDTPGLSILEARAKARRQMRGITGTDKKGLIIVDYLQLMNPPVHRRDGNRAVEVGEISRGLKVLAKELDVPVVALSQLNRSVETRGTKYKRPMLSDLRESGSIEQDADIVMFIDRSMDEIEASEESRPDLGCAEIQVAKHRNGPTKDITLSFQGEFTKFSDFADQSRYQV